MSPKQSETPLRVLGLDPGLADVGWGVVEHRPAHPARLLDYGVVQTQAGAPLAHRLDLIYRGIEDVIEVHAPAVAAVEQLYFARNVKTAMVVAHGRAACILATARRQLEVFEYTPLQIKQALTGHGRARKDQVQQMVRVVLAMDDVPRPDHAADALAAAICHINLLGLREKIARVDRGLAAQAGEDDQAGAARRLLLQARRPRRRRRR